MAKICYEDHRPVSKILLVSSMRFYLVVLPKLVLIVADKTHLRFNPLILRETSK